MLFTELNAVRHDIIVTIPSVLGNNGVRMKFLHFKGQSDKIRNRTICDLRILRITITLLEFAFFFSEYNEGKKKISNEKNPQGI